jgi:hypothetical protein
MTRGDQSSDDPPIDERFHYPAPLKPAIAEDEPEESDEIDYAVLCSVPAAEVQSFCRRLEREGVPCAYEPDCEQEDKLPEQRVYRVLVESSELDRAREIIAEKRDPAERAAEEEAYERHIQARGVEDWICPVCQRRTLNPVPMTPRMRWIRRLLVISIAVPILTALLIWATDAEKLLGDPLPLPDHWHVYWIGVVAFFGCALAAGSTHRRCRKCGWTTGDKIPARPFETDDVDQDVQGES